MTLTDEWLEMYEQHRAAGTLNHGFYWRMAKLLGAPLGVDDTDPRVVAALEEINRVAVGAAE